MFRDIKGQFIKQKYDVKPIPTNILEFAINQMLLLLQIINDYADVENSSFECTNTVNSKSVGEKITMLMAWMHITPTEFIDCIISNIDKIAASYILNSLGGGFSLMNVVKSDKLNVPFETLLHDEKMWLIVNTPMFKQLFMQNVFYMRKNDKYLQITKCIATDEQSIECGTNKSITELRESIVNSFKIRATREKVEDEKSDSTETTLSKFEIHSRNAIQSLYVEKKESICETITRSNVVTDALATKLYELLTKEDNEIPSILIVLMYYLDNVVYSIIGLLYDNVNLITINSFYSSFVLNIAHDPIAGNKVKKTYSDVKI